ncbi:MAG: AMP-binding protein [Proteobacteria bacterium]|nr:AMP-binding protein [Pseudomonadota bacterium]
MEAIQYAHPAIECLDRDGILAIQERKLKALGERLQGHPEWVRHFQKADMSPRDLGNLDALSSVPTLDKADLRALYPFPMLTAELAQVRRFVATSGTSGMPVMFGLTDRDLSQLLPHQMSRILRAAGIVAGDRVYQGYGYGLWFGGLGMDIGLAACGAVNFPIGPGRGDLVVKWLSDHAYTACTVSPLWLMTLVNLAKSQNIDPRKAWKLRVGVFGGQSISAAFRDQLEAEMPPGFMAQNNYGTTEAGGPVVAQSCPYSHDVDEMHLINEDTIITEVVDPATMKRVGPGEVGEIVVTTLDRDASPVIRWRTRDLVKLSAKPYDCPCGRAGLPKIGRIIGRNDDMLKVRGVIVFPTQIEDIIAETEGAVKEAWQIYIDSEHQILEEITVAVERRGGASSIQEKQDVQQRLAHALHSRLGIRVTVECHDEGSLPRYEGKAVRVHRRGAKPEK